MAAFAVSVNDKVMLRTLLLLLISIDAFVAARRAAASFTCSDSQVYTWIHKPEQEAEAEWAVRKSPILLYIN